MGLSMNVVYRVDVIEHERGWGSKLFFQKDFPTKAEAESFAKEFNSENISHTAPDWYAQAERIYLVDLDEENNAKL